MALRTFDVRRRFDRAADTFDDFDFVHAVTRAGLMTRLEPMLVEARSVVDLGCATGSACKALAKKFRGAHIVAVDQSAGMLKKAGAKQPWFSKFSLVQANAASLPFADQSVDVVFCNQLLPWVEDFGAVFTEVARVLRKDGLFLFASLGPDSFSELRRAWQSVDDGQHVHLFPDMHDIGDAAVRAGMHDPVLDVDRLSVTYGDAAALFRDLDGCAARNCLSGRSAAMTGKRRFAAMAAELQLAGHDDRIELDLELVYGHCWGSGPRAREGEVRIPLDRIERRF